MTTIKTIAKIAGVNISTVSRALTGRDGVSDETRERIKKLASEMNYSPDFSARAMVGKSTKLVGVIVPEISSSYYSQIIDRIEYELNLSGFSIIIETTSFNEQKEMHCFDTLNSRKVDGIIFINIVSDKTMEYIHKNLKKTYIPTVFLEPMVDAENHDSIIIDGEEGIRYAIKHFVDLGHKSISFIGEDLSTRYRLPIFKKILTEYDIAYKEEHIKSGKERFELGGYLRMKELLAMKCMPTAIFAVYDYVAIGAMRALQEAGLIVPKDISIIGYDNIRESEYLTIPLTTVCPPITEMAEKGVKLILKRINNGMDAGSESIKLLTTLIVRESTSTTKNNEIV